VPQRNALIDLQLNCVHRQKIPTSQCARHSPNQYGNEIIGNPYKHNLIYDDLSIKTCRQKEGAVDVWMKFYERGPNRAELEKQFFTELDNPLLGKAFKLAMIGDWLAANGLDQGSYTPTNSELLEVCYKIKQLYIYQDL
jgi:hypothetical protein